MAIENIQYVYDHIRFYRRALKTVNNQFFMWLQKEQRNRQEKLNKTCEKTPSKSFLAPRNMFN